MLIRTLTLAAFLVTFHALELAAQDAASVVGAASKAMGAANLNSITYTGTSIRLAAAATCSVVMRLRVSTPSVSTTSALCCGSPFPARLALLATKLAASAIASYSEVCPNGGFNRASPSSNFATSWVKSLT